MNWIKVDDKLPAKEQNGTWQESSMVWVNDQDDGITLARYNYRWKEWVCEFLDAYGERAHDLRKVTHWQPAIMPEPPK